MLWDYRNLKEISWMLILKSSLIIRIKILIIALLNKNVFNKWNKQHEKWLKFTIFRFENFNFMKFFVT